jgi:hypothetical protein
MSTVVVKMNTITSKTVVKQGVLAEEASDDEALFLLKNDI